LIEERYILVSKTIQTAAGAHWPSYSMGIEVIFQTGIYRGVKLATYLHLALKLTMSGAMPLLTLYAFIAWTGAALYISSQ
jgi:hypothetical protein